MSRFRLQRHRTMTWNTTMPHQWLRLLKILEVSHTSVRKVCCKRKWWVDMIETNPPSSPWISQGKLVPTQEWPQWTQLLSSMSSPTSTLLPHLVWPQWKRPLSSTLWALNQVVNTILKCRCSCMGTLRQHQVLYQHPKEKVAKRFQATSKEYRRTSNN